MKEGYELEGQLEPQANDGPDDWLHYVGIISREDRRYLVVRASGRPSRLFEMTGSEGQRLRMAGVGLSSDPDITQRYKRLTEDAVDRILEQRLVTEEEATTPVVTVDLETGEIKRD